jgi:hypothetical protein
MNKHFCEYHLTSLARRENKENEKCYDEGTKRIVNAADMTPRLLCEEHYHHLYSDVMRHGNVMATKKKKEDGGGFKVMYDNNNKEKQ